MFSESPELGLLSLFSLISFFIFLVTNKFSFKIGRGVLLDAEFEKPQAFHKKVTPRSGGLAAIICLTLFFGFYFLIFEKFLFDYIFLSLFIFILGFLEDIKFKIKPNLRLLLMIIILFSFIILFSITINGVDLYFLKVIISKSNLFAFIFALICFLFILNGSNLIDGFNGLLAIHLIIINLILVFINFNNNHEDLALIIISQIIILFSFLVFNFPNAKMFMGDRGSYLFGSLVAYNIINTNNANPEISSFFFCILLFYLFFEVFFSFFRKIYQKKSPIKPDDRHLHMLSYKILKWKFPNKNCNYVNSIIINLSYSLLVLPSILFKDNGILCKYWFFLLIIFYIFAYSRLNSFLKKRIDI